MNQPYAAQRVSLVVNAGSRTGKEAFPQAVQALDDLGVSLDSRHAVKNPVRLPGIVRDVLDDGCDLLVLGGGDGTVSAVVDELAHHSAALAVLPLGTANDFARTMEIPSDVQEACETVANGKLVDVDLGLAGHNYYANVASVGLASGVTHELSARLKKFAGPLAYPVATAKALVKHHPFALRLTFPDGDHEPVEADRLLQVAVGNGRFYGGGNVVAPGSGIDDRMLDVYTIEQGRTRDLVNVAYHFKSGGFVNTSAARHYRTPRVTVETDPELAINLDGEIEQRTPQHFSVAENALRIVVPQHSSAAEHDGAAVQIGRAHV